MLPKPNHGFAWVQAAAGPGLVCRALEPHAVHLFTTRHWRLGDPDANAAAAWADVARAVNAGPDNLVRAQQVHGADVIACSAHGDRPVALDGRLLPRADILVCPDAAHGLAIQTADCVPILIADTRTGAVAAAHAGWRGLAAGVPRVVVEGLATAAGSRPQDLVAAIGPSISAARYEVDAPVRDAFVSAGFGDRFVSAWFSKTRPGHWQFDGWTSARDQLIDAGVAAGRIHVAELCTAMHAEVFCSYRRDAQRAGRMAAAIRRRS